MIRDYLTMEPEYFLKPEEFHLLIQAAASPRDRLALLLLGCVGLRLSEMIQVKAEDLDLDAGYLFIRASKAMGKKDHTVILPPSVIAELKAYLMDNAINHGYIFTGRTSGHISSRQIQLVLNSLAEKSGIQFTKFRDKAGRERHRVTPHLLRHSFAIWSLESGIPLSDIQEQLGHTTLKATIVYIQTNHNRLKESYYRFGFSDKLLPAAENNRGQAQGNDPEKGISEGFVR
jgi:integrase/recombinase XerD